MPTSRLPARRRRPQPAAGSYWQSGLVQPQSQPVQPQPEPLQCISALTLVTADMARAVEFYRAAGFRLQYGGADSEFTSFRVGTGYLNLQLDSSRERPGGAIWGRAIFWVDDVDRMYRRVLAAGARPEAPPADAPWGERYFHVRDPDGHELSFAHPLGDL